MMKMHVLEKHQKDEILSILMEHGFEHSCFRWLETLSDLAPDTVVSRLVCLPNGFYYSFERQDTLNVSIFSHGRVAHVETDYAETWKTQCECFTKWLRLIIEHSHRFNLKSTLFQTDTIHNSIGKQAYVTSLTSESIDNSSFSSHLEHLLDMTRSSIETKINNPNNPGFIKRYYGKA